jgi:fatty acid desaturase
MRARLELTANRLRRSPWVTAVVALGIGVALALPAWNASDFYPAFVATYIGAALGFLVAIYIDHLKRAEDEAASRQVQEAADERERARVAEVTRTRRVAVLLLLRTELGHVPTQMEHRLSRDHPPSWDDPLTDILWRSLSSSGELRWRTSPCCS